jgi:hypothetical protein
MRNNNYFNALGDYSSLISTAVDFGIQYMTAKGESKKNEELLQQLSQLDKQQADKLKKILTEVATEDAKTKAVIDFLNEQKIKRLEDETKKKRILPLVGLGFMVVLLGIIFLTHKKENG